MGITPIKAQVTDAFLYSLGNFQPCILLVSALCPIISNAVFRSSQKASLCAGCHLQVNSTVMNLGISISPIIGWYQSAQSSNGKNEENTLQKKLADSNTSWKYRYSTMTSHYQQNTKEKYDSVSSKIAVLSLKTKEQRLVCTLLHSGRGNKARSVSSSLSLASGKVVQRPHGQHQIQCSQFNWMSIIKYFACNEISTPFIFSLDWCIYF